MDNPHDFGHAANSQPATVLQAFVRSGDRELFVFWSQQRWRLVMSGEWHESRRSFPN